MLGETWVFLSLAQLVTLHNLPIYRDIYKVAKRSDWDDFLPVEWPSDGGRKTFSQTSAAAVAESQTELQEDDLPDDVDDLSDDNDNKIDDDDDDVIDDDNNDQYGDDVFSDNPDPSNSAVAESQTELQEDDSDNPNPSNSNRDH